MPSNITHLLLLSVSILVVGCGTMHANPVSGPTARLRVQTLNSEYYYTWNRDATETCSRDSPNFAMTGSDVNPDAFVSGMPGYGGPKSDRFETVIRADRPTKIWQSTMRSMSIGEAVLSQTNVFSAAYTAGKMWSCDMVTSFEPKSGKDYELISDFQPGSCKVSVSELSTAADGTVSRAPVAISVIGGPQMPNVCSLPAK